MPAAVKALGQMFLKRGIGPLAERRVVELGSGSADDPQPIRQQPIGVQPVKRGQQHPPGEIAGRAEQHQGRDPVGHAGVAILLFSRAHRRKCARRKRVFRAASRQARS